MAKVVNVKVFRARTISRVRAAAIPALLKCALLVEREAKAGMRKGGRIKGRKTGVPSPPGHPPHVQTGVLRSSIHSATTMTSAVVGPTAKYGKFHEFGTRMHPKRPFMRPALMAAKNKFAAQFRGLTIK